MNEPMSLERMVATWMADAAATTAPSEQQLVEQIITATAQQRPRPRWLALLQESPMTAQSRVLVGSPPRRLALTAILLLIAAIAAAGIGAYLVQQQKPATSDDWPGFRGDAAHSGVVGHGPIGNPVVAWKTSLAGPIRNAVSILGDETFVASDEGTLTAFGTTDGAKHWTFSAPAPMGGPYAVGGVVYAVDGQGAVHAIKAADGTPVWASTVKIAGATDGVVSGGLLYYASSDGVVVALDTKTGAEVWRRAVSPTPITMKFPTVVDDLLIAADLHGFMTALDASSGEVRWAEQLPIDTPGTPVIAGGSVYLGGGSDATSGNLVALKASDGSEQWRIDRPLSAPSIFGTTGYVTGLDGTIAAIDLTSGKTLWEARFPAGQMRTPAVTDTIVYGYTDSTRTLFALDRATGGQLWTFDLDGSNQCCIALSKGNVYVATDVGTVYAIAGDNATLAVGPIPQAAPSVVTPTTAPTAATPALPAPKLEWIADHGPADFVPWLMAKAPDGRLWAAIGLKDTFAIFGPDGTYLESWGTSGTGKGEFNMRRANGDPFGMVAFAKDGSFYVLDSGNHRVQVFDKDRTFVREWGTLGKGPGQFTETGGIVVDTDGNVVVIDNVRAVIETYKPDGTVVSTIPAFPEDLHATPGVNRGANQIHIGPNGHYFLSIVEPNVLAEIDRAGKLVRTYGATGQPCAIVEQPNGVAWDAAGRMYLAQGAVRGDAPGIVVFGPDGSCLGGFGKLGAGDADLGFTVDLIVDETGIYTSDAGGLPDFGLRSAIRKFEPIDFPN
jgi:outer membrane protein assembly factor BamB